MKKRRSIAKLYKPTYIEDKKDIEMIDHYIKLEGEGFEGKIFTGKSDLVKWRVKSKAEKGKIDQNDLYEVNQIVKRYNFDMKQKIYGFTNNYINTFTDLLYKKKGKTYMKKRKEMLKESEKKDRKLLTHTIRQTKGFYITEQQRESEFNSNTNSNQTNRTKRKIFERLNTKHFTQFNLRSMISKGNNEDDIELNISEEEKINSDNVIKNKHFFIDKLKTEYNFFHPKKKTSTLELKHQRMRRCVLGSNVEVEFTKFHKPSQNEFFSKLNRRMLKEGSFSNRSERKVMPRLFKQYNII